jgi:hypothetical protein
MVLEPKLKTFKDQYKIKERVKIFIYFRRHLSIPRAFQLYYFKVILNW